MSCQDCEELLGVRALGALSDTERADVDAHLATCSRCTLILREFQSIADLLPLAVPEVEPPPALKERLLAQIQTASPAQTPPQARQTRPRGRFRRWRTQLAVVAAALVCALLGALSAWNISLQQQLAAQPTIYTVQGTSAAVDTRGQLFYYPQQHMVILVMHQLPPLKATQVYQGWLLQGKQTTSLGLLNIQDGTATLTFLGDIQNYDAAAVSLEEGPQASEGTPKGPVIATASLKTPLSLHYNPPPFE